MINRKGYVELGLACADVCKTLDRGLNHTQTDRLGRPVLEAIEQLAAWVETSGNAHCSQLAYSAFNCRTVAQIQRSAVEPDKRNLISRIFNPKKDKDAIAAWRSELNRIVHVFEVCSTVRSPPTLLTVHLQTELALYTHVAVSDIREDVVDIRGDVVDIREEVANARELISDVHRVVVKDQDGADIRNQAVGNHGILFTVEKFLHFLGWSQVWSFNCSHRHGTLPLNQITRRIASPTAGSLFRTGQVNREDCQPCRKPHLNRSHRCRWYRENVSRPVCPPRRSNQEAIQRQPPVHPL